jgi:hypothetical protein
VDSKLVAAALVLDKAGALHWTVEMTPEEAYEFLKQAETYNGIPKNVAGLVDAVRQVVPAQDYGPDNPNTGRTHHTFEIGNAYSRVVFLKINEVYLPDHAGPKPFFEGLAEACTRIAKRFHADEADVVRHNNWEWRFRFWWD